MWRGLRGVRVERGLGIGKGLIVVGLWSSVGSRTGAGVVAVGVGRGEAYGGG